jgi:hypothetical protein
LTLASSPPPSDRAPWGPFRHLKCPSWSGACSGPHRRGIRPQPSAQSRRSRLLRLLAVRKDLIHRGSSFGPRAKLPGGPSRDLRQPPPRPCVVLMSCLAWLLSVRALSTVPDAVRPSDVLPLSLSRCVLPPPTVRTGALPCSQRLPRFLLLQRRWRNGVPRAALSVVVVRRRLRCLPVRDRA